MTPLIPVDSFANKILSSFQGLYSIILCNSGSVDVTNLGPLCLVHHNVSNKFFLCVSNSSKTSLFFCINSINSHNSSVRTHFDCRNLNCLINKMGCSLKYREYFRGSECTATKIRSKRFLNFWKICFSKSTLLPKLRPAALPGNLAETQILRFGPGILNQNL